MVMRFYAGIFSVLVVLALIPCQVGAQPAETGTIEGHVLDASTQEPLPGVNLVLIGTNRGTTTNNEGYFRLTGVTAGTYQLQASFIGYVPLRQAVRVEAGQTVTLQLTLQPDVLNLQAAVVTATRTERTQREVPVSMQVMNARELERAAPTYSIADQLRTVPGLYGENGGGEVAANVFVRGIPAPGQFRYMTIQEDGMPLQTAINLSAQDVLFRYDLTVDRVEVVKGGNAIIFGSNRPGGIINYRSKTGGSTHETELLLTLGERNLYRLDFNTGGPLSERVRFNLGGFYRMDRGPLVSGLPTEGGQIKGNITVLVNNGYLRFYYKYINDRVQFFLPIPYRRGTTDPAIDAEGTLNTSEAARFAFPVPEGLFVRGTFQSQMENGVLTQGSVLQLDLFQELGRGWVVQNKVRYSDLQHQFNIFIPRPAVDREVFVSQILSGLLGNQYDRNRYRGRYTLANSPEVIFEGQQVLQQGAWYRNRPLTEIANELEIRKNLSVGDVTHAITVGAFLARTRQLQQRWAAETLVEMRSRPRMLDLYIEDAGPDGLFGTEDDGAGWQVTRDGIVNLSSNYINADLATDVMALFAGDELQIGERTRIDVGLRYERQYSRIWREETTIADSTGPTLAEQGYVIGTGKFVERRALFDDWAAFVGLNYALNEHVNLYASGTRGFRIPDVSVFSSIARDATGAFIQPTPSRNEQFLMGEVGVKYGSSRFGATAALYVVNIQNRLQTDLRILPDGRSANVTEAVGEAQTIGGELTMVWTPAMLPGLQLNGSLTYQDHEAVEFVIPQPNGEVIDYSGNDIKRIPQFFGTLQVNYNRHPISIGISWDRYGPKYADDANLQRLDGFDVINLTLDYQFALAERQQLRLGLYVNNLLNNRGLTEGDPRLGPGQDPNLLPFYNARPILPRRALIKVHYQF